MTFILQLTLGFAYSCKFCPVGWSQLWPQICWQQRDYSFLEWWPWNIL